MGSFWATIWDTIWWFLTIFIFVAYLMALFSIITDLFRDRKLGGVAKAIWLLFLIFLPFLTALAYLTLAKLPAWLGDWIGARVQRLAFGDLRPYGLTLSDMPPTRQLRETGKTPVIDIGTVGQIKAGRISVKPGIERFTETGARFEDGTEEPFDAVILATGYRAQLEDFLPFTDGLFDQYGIPKEVVGKGKYKGLYFLGFDNYKPGGGLGVIRQDSEVVAEAIGGRGIGKTTSPGVTPPKGSSQTPS